MEMTKEKQAPFLPSSSRTWKEEKIHFRAGPPPPPYSERWKCLCGVLGGEGILLRTSKL